MDLKIYFMQNISTRYFIISNLNLYGQLFDWTCNRIFIFIKIIVYINNSHSIEPPQQHGGILIGINK
jgi:hypothetical protein